MSIMSDKELVNIDPATITYSGNKQKILEMLGNGMSPEVTSSAMGVSPSYISQLLSDEEFSLAVTARRYNLLQKHNKRDSALDDLEDKLIDKIRDLIPLMYKPMEILRAFQMINAARRRGTAGAMDNGNIMHSTVVNLTIPVVIQQKFIKDTNNQVIGIIENAQEVQPKIKEHSLVTLPSGGLKKLLASRSLTSDEPKITSSGSGENS